MSKLNVATGAEIWTMTDFGDSAGAHGAFEMINAKSDGDHVILTGVKDKPNLDEMAFKSYGNVPNGKAFALRINTGESTS